MIKKILLTIIERVYPDLLFAAKSYSQDGEDMIIRSFYEEKKNYKGFYVDVGAHHPLRFSNTAFFYKKKWRGINIEPTPSLMPAFRRKRKRDINLNVGVANQTSKLTFFEFDEPALNSFNETVSMHKAETTRYKIVGKKEIQVHKLADILDKHLPENQKIDFLTIDVEGLDLDVLKSNNWTKYRPAYILVEGAADFEKLAEDPIFTFLQEQTYKLVSRTKRTFVFAEGLL